MASTLPVNDINCPKLISILTACFNEQENVLELYEQVKEVFRGLPQYRYEHLFIDNCSMDNTVDILRQIAATDKNVRVIINARNFGHIRSPIHGMFQTHGEAVISVVADLQDPPPMIIEFLKKWEEGHKIVVGVKIGSDEAKPMYLLRRIYYYLLTSLSEEIKLIRNFTGFGLYDRRVIEIMRQINDPYPYFRGLISDIGFEHAEIPYHQPLRKRGVTKNNFYSLYDMVMLGLTNHSKVPLRLATMTGLIAAFVSFLLGMAYLVYKLIFWYSFSVGVAPLVIGVFFFASIQLFFLGIVGEYVGAIHTQVQMRPLVVERERINFDDPPTSTNS